MYLKNRIGPCIWPQTIFKPHQKENMQIKMVSMEGKVYNVMLQSTLALWTPCYYGHPDNTDSCWIPGKKLQTCILTETNSQHYGLTDTSQSGYQSAPFDILAELSQFIIYFFLFLSSSLSLWLKSEHSDSLLTWSFYETTVLTSGLDVATCGVANVTSFYSVVTK